ncbi:cupin domain-containing protein [Cyanobacterium aponinum UTEX 3222]|uniref:Sugar 3,4-ketoisomerase QdtA cupin domain-containing protein n=3 Tax=Cyanobacterium aponinum TaxID=379064 RepID=K9Z383_CYAAP|nr:MULTISPECIES: cupin domain-containing protein [Cyanobacterium]WRL41505.1 cupin domain-containing protein [Cyanobacterium aponinum UTEX 3222]AFZ53614.1 hypothetical protein Cyan10605_1504 [Cyanobacterium aponinum PCC 10605]MBD2393398.1 cupin domain-containing protein [Cyanobacterium aponinum FACHB-4101]MTF40640.1 dTDP-4-dehydrorhamnose 3,5-epimerase [Cyanobacterium aponinum 0216]PHV61827.1 dTDP-4-dehydrorhamnose 3,5-epimerase [Cyanobacterium aponinum IPPAS B-1201]
MAQIKSVSQQKLQSIQGGMALFYTPQSSHETMLVQIPPHTIDDLFVHHFQTDQLLVVKGNFVLVVLQNRQYQYLHLTENNPQVITIPPGIPHGAINLSNDSCLLVNAVLRHGETHVKDYQPIKRPFAYNLDLVKKLTNQQLVINN